MAVEHHQDHMQAFHGSTEQIRKSMSRVNDMPSLPKHEIDRDEFASIQTPGVNDQRYYGASRLPAIASDQKTAQAYARNARRPVID